MKRGMGAVLVGLAAGVVTYWVFLSAFVVFVLPRHQMSYVLMPMGASTVAQLRVMWEFHRFEMIVVLVGLLLGLTVFGLVWSWARNSSWEWINRLWIQLLLAWGVVGISLLIINLVRFALRV